MTYFKAYIIHSRGLTDLAMEEGALDLIFILKKDPINCYNILLMNFFGGDREDEDKRRDKRMVKIDV